MASLPTARAELEALRTSLVPPWQEAKARGDRARMDQLSRLAGEIDDALDDLAILGYAQSSARIAGIRAKIDAALKRAKSFPFAAFDQPPFSANVSLLEVPDGAARNRANEMGAALDLDRPSRASFGESIGDRLATIEQPAFITLAEVKHKFLGPRPNGLEGAIVHYDAGRSRPAKGPDDAEWGAKNTLIHGQNNGFAYATISRSGKVYLPGNMDWDRWGSHAGKSRCPSTSREAVSQFYVGFEINSPGFVYPTDDADLFVPWFDAVRDADGNVVLNKKGHATIAKADGEIYKKAQLRKIASQTANIRPGFYVPYTDAQYNALFHTLLWLKRNFKKSFRLDFVFGHDEVSPGRKVDPGGSLGKHANAAPGAATTMPELRADLLKAWADQQLLVA